MKKSDSFANIDFSFLKTNNILYRFVQILTYVIMHMYIFNYALIHCI